MRFGFHLFMVDPAEFLDLARTADECGWDSIQVADAPFFPEVTSAPYPYTPDGKRFWPLDLPVLDPWVAITAMAIVTKRIRFLPSVLRLAIRQPLLEAKSLCSVAAVSNDRVALGVGLAWMPEEFKWLNQDKKTRGARQNEAIQVIRLLLGGGMVEFHGKYFDFDRLTMAPVPKRRIPIYVGGTTKPALRRAARYGDGWLGVVHPMEEIKGLVAELGALRRECGREKESFDIMLHCPDAQTMDDIRRLEEMGVTDLQVTPWTLPGIMAKLGVSAMRVQPPLAVKQEAIKRYADEMIAKCQSADSGCRP
jgi:probable F420-dependent oxidoreductase